MILGAGAIFQFKRVQITHCLLVLVNSLWTEFYYFIAKYSTHLHLLINLVYRASSKFYHIIADLSTVRYHLKIDNKITDGVRLKKCSLYSMSRVRSKKPIIKLCIYSQLQHERNHDIPTTFARHQGTQKWCYPFKLRVPKLTHVYPSQIHEKIMINMTLAWFNCGWLMIEDHHLISNLDR